ncbi:VOC family protein [Paenibacillus glycanilyticus]|uniref:VOC family protein n=1 Tax=Paenibacillus glycanilyticus TaxID=126569 RepID=UPI0037C9C638
MRRQYSRLNWYYYENEVPFIGLLSLIELQYIKYAVNRKRKWTSIKDFDCTPTPDLSIEVNDLDATLGSIKRAGFPIEYGPADEPWGVRRFYVRDPFGKLINILSHD